MVALNYLFSLVKYGVDLSNIIIQFWETIEAPEFILNTIREGIKFPSSLNQSIPLSRTTVLPNYIAISLAMQSMSY